MRIASMALILCTAGCYNINGTINGLHLSMPEQMMQGAGAYGGANVITWDGKSEQDLSKSGTVISDVKSATIQSVQLSPKMGGPLDFIKAVKLVLPAKDASMSDVTLVDASDIKTTDDGSILFNTPVDIDPALISGLVTMNSHIEFAPPADPWSFSLDMVASITGGVTLKP